MTTALPAQTAAPTRRRFTVDEFLAMDRAGIFHPDERLELLDGDVWVRAPIGIAQGDGTDRLGNGLTLRLHERALVRVRGPVQLDNLNLPVPDIAILRRRHDYHRAHPTPIDIFLVVEVTGSSIPYAHEDRLSRYAAAGIPEFWIPKVLPTRQVEAFHDPVDGVYQSSRIVSADGRISPRAFPDVVLTVGEFLLGDPGSEGDETRAPGTDS